MITRQLFCFRWICTHNTAECSIYHWAILYSAEFSQIGNIGCFVNQEFTVNYVIHQ